MNLINKLLVFCMVLLLCTGTGLAQKVTQAEKTITGRVFDNTGAPLIGVSVVVKNKPGLGHITDQNGKFMIKANTYDVLVFSYIGYTSLEVPIQGKTRFDKVVMQETSQNLDEVVVVAGNTTQRKLTSTGAITTISPNTLKGISSGNLTNSLAGNVAGIIAQQTSGEPGKNMSEFWVRGINTFGANSSALILVDGIERNLNELNVEDIESFSVLKDASATAIYGQRGANGVVLITTKRGKEGKVNIDFKGEYSVIGHVKMPQYVDGVQYAKLENEALITRYKDPKYSDEEIEIIKYQLDPDLYPNVNWRDFIMKDTSPSYKGSLNISGGGSTARYYISGSYYNEQGMYRTRDYNTYNTNIKYQRYNYRANVDVNITKTTSLEMGIGGWIALNDGPTTSTNDVWNSLVYTTPITVPIIYSNGFVPTYGLGNYMNPDAVINRVGYSQATESKMETNITLKQDLNFLLKGLRFTGRYAFDTYGYQNVVRTKRPDMYHAEPQRDNNGNLVMRRVINASPLAQKSINSGNRRTYMEGSLSYENLFGNAHRVTALLMYYQEELKNSADVGTNIKLGIPKRHMAFSGRLTYSYKDRYLLEGNFGYTGSENFEKSHRFGWFPAVSAGWVISEEPLIKKATSNWLDMFKVRASYGKVGNDQISSNDADRFPFITSVGTADGFSFGESGTGGIQGYGITTMGARNLSWEVATKLDIGIDLNLFKGLVTLTADIFKDKRDKIFLQRNNIPYAVGLRNMTTWANIGKMDSHGFDGNLAIHHKFGNVDLTVRGNWTYSTNDVKDYDEAVNALRYQMTKGYRWNQVRGLVCEGIFNNQADIDNSPKQTFGTYNPGDLKYKDVNGDGKINSNDVVPLGYTNSPNLTYGIGMSALWKGIDFNILFQGSGKSSFFLGGNTKPFRGGDSGNILIQVADINNRWVSSDISGTTDTERADAIFPRLTFGDNSNNNQNSDHWLRSSRYLRLKTLEIGYTIPTSLTHKWYMEKVRFYFMGNNLMIFSPFKWWDAESANSNGGNYPINKTFTLGVQLSF